MEQLLFYTSYSSPNYSIYYLGIYSCPLEYIDKLLYYTPTSHSLLLGLQVHTKAFQNCHNVKTHQLLYRML